MRALRRTPTIFRLERQLRWQIFSLYDIAWMRLGLWNLGKIRALKRAPEIFCFKWTIARFCFFRQGGSLSDIVSDFEKSLWLAHSWESAEMMKWKCNNPEMVTEDFGKGPDLKPKENLSSERTDRDIWCDVQVKGFGSRFKVIWESPSLWGFFDRTHCKEASKAGPRLSCCVSVCLFENFRVQTRDSWKGFLSKAPRFVWNSSSDDEWGIWGGGEDQEANKDRNSNDLRFPFWKDTAQASDSVWRINTGSSLKELCNWAWWLIYQSIWRRVAFWLLWFWAATPNASLDA